MQRGIRLRLELAGAGSSGSVWLCKHWEGRAATEAGPALGTRFKSTIRWLSGGHQVLLLCSGPWALGMATGLPHSLFLWTVNLC